jgi:hypothetical protein
VGNLDVPQDANIPARSVGQWERFFPLPSFEKTGKAMLRALDWGIGTNDDSIRRERQSD